MNKSLNGETFAERLRYIIAELKLTQSQLAEIVGIRQSQVSNLLNGVSEPNYRTLKQLKEKLRLSAEDLL